MKSVIETTEEVITHIRQLKLLAPSKRDTRIVLNRKRIERMRHHIAISQLLQTLSEKDTLIYWAVMNKHRIKQCNERDDT